MRVKTDYPRRIRTLPHEWIPMPDGCRLAARIVLPEDAEDDPVPAVLECIPYRKNDGTAVTDAVRHPYFAGHGYASVRLDLRGSGDSDGILTDEYLESEQNDIIETIRWLAAQPWCTGKVGMIGLSWGGFASLQVAARHPPELGAIVAVGATHDRYNDDVHYSAGCVFQPMLGWASTMVAFNARPPDPAVVGDRWRGLWLARMEQSPPYVEAWLTHQRYDDYWKHGSVKEQYDDVRCPVYIVSGWMDWYRNPVLALLEGLSVPRKGLIGPWAHVYPEEGTPGPAIGFLQDCVRWWDHWLKGIDTGLMEEPMLRVWMPEPLGPGSHPVSVGRWVAEDEWPSPNVETRPYALGADGLSEHPGKEAALTITGLQTAGAESSGWVAAPDQRLEDGRWLCFDSEPFAERIEIFGIPCAELALAANRPCALVAVRLCDVGPDGTSTLMTRGLLNLTHRNGHEAPEPIEPGARFAARVRLDLLGHVLLPGHRLRVALSPTYWPRAWPSPEPVTLTVFAGPDSRLELPVRPPRTEDETLRPFEEAERGPELDYEPLQPAADLSATLAAPRATRYPASGRTEVAQGRGEGYRFPDGLVHTHVARGEFSIVEGNPLSARAHNEHTVTVGRDSWQTRVETESVMTSDAESFLVTNALEGFEGDVRVFAKSWTFRVPRALV